MNQLSKCRAIICKHCLSWRFKFTK